MRLLAPKVSMRRGPSTLLPPSATSSHLTSASAAAMYPRPKYRGGGNPSRRGFFDSANRGRGQSSSDGSNFHSIQDANRGFQRGAGRNIVTGDSHLRSVQNANHALRRGEMNLPNRSGVQPQPFSTRRPYFYDQTYGLTSANINNPQFGHPQDYNQSQVAQGYPAFGQYQKFQQRLPQKQSQPSWRPPQFDQNSASRPSQRQRSGTARPPDYRNWEYAKALPPSNFDRFVVLSYNILADYLAMDHQDKLYKHIPDHMLDWQWRKRNILFELALWSADIMCFQEVDKFYELEGELKSRGYSGIWKMRTGNPVDGCAIFWRVSRFKLLQEECIEFNKLGLRDNVAQICVLELVRQSETGNETDQQASSAGSNKVIICNIHVLYNPKRGEIKLGQIRVLLDRAYEVSRLWDDAPVALCGDFNCTPKSPLYNFIAEQKLSLSGLDRDKLSGQASAEIRAPRPYSQVTRDEYNPNQAPLPEDFAKLSGSILSEQKQSNQYTNTANFHDFAGLSSHKYTDNHLDASAMSGSNWQSASQDRESNYALRKECKQIVAEGATNKTQSPSHASVENMVDSTGTVEGIEFPFGDKITDTEKDMCNVASPSFNEQLVCLQARERMIGSTASFAVKDCANQVTGPESGNSSDDMITFSGPLSQKSTSDNAEAISPEDSGDLSINSMLDNPSTSHEVDALLSDSVANVNDELKKLSLNTVEESSEEVGCSYEDDNTFLSELHNLKGPDHSSGSQIIDEFSASLDFEPSEEQNYKYDRSAWTPTEIATATGSADCLLVEHPLKLKSSYTEVEDSSGTRDASGEPIVTSYNRCFMGTVDYIWHSEGLQTVRVRAPIPKQAMQWTSGFPTKKWGSDHIALVSELALTKGVADRGNEAR